MIPQKPSAEDAAWIDRRVREEGFDLCGIAPLEEFPELARGAEWLARGYAGEMKYLADPRRQSPAGALSEARSAIVCGLNYNTAFPYSTKALDENLPHDPPRGWISRYAWGDDYHDLLWAKLNAVAAAMRARFDGDFQARGYADTGPIHERVLAKYAGLGWLAKNTLLINQQLGSWFFLGVILTSLDFPKYAEAPPPDLCGTCRRCIDACPTAAIVEPYVLDARRCISYLTIELRGEIPGEFRSAMGRHVFGCDICQDVCPWNRKAPVTNLPQFQPRLASRNPVDESLFQPRLEWLASLAETEFRETFRGSAVKRTKWRGIVRNACIALGNAAADLDHPARTRILDLLKRLTTSAEPVIRDSAQWAVSRIQLNAGTDAARGSATSPSS